MPIPFTRYVLITSGVGAGAESPRRDLIARLFTTSTDMPTNAVMEFTNADDVGEFFGTDSEEFRRSQFYFGFTSKIITRPSRISFYRWVDSAAAATVYGGIPETLAVLQTIVSGTFSLTIGDSTQEVAGLDFSSDTTFAEIAATLQTRIRALTGVQFDSATVTYNAQRNRFELVSGNVGAAPISTAAGTTNDAADQLGLLLTDAGFIVSPGANQQTITEALTQSEQLSNNFGSFAFISNLTQSQVVEAATWNSTRNILYQYHVPVTAANAAAYSMALIGIAGTGITLDPETNNEWPEMLPMAILAATDYTRQSATMNYMFQSANLTPSVSSNTDANLYDGQRINYYGETQTAGQLRRFYQRGVLTGDPATVPVDMGVYSNEQWLKDDAGSRFMTLLLTRPGVSANQAGRGDILATLQGTIDQAALNGTIQTGTTLTTAQQLFITEQSGDPLAYQQVQTIGYWVDAEIQRTTTVDGRTEFKANYDLIYTVDNSIRMVCGTHTLI